MRYVDQEMCSRNMELVATLLNVEVVQLRAFA